MNTIAKICLCFTALVALARPAAAADLPTDIPLPSKTVNGVTTVSWPGTYAELLTADALAACWTTQQDRFAGISYAAADSYLQYLQGLMSQATCKSSCATPVTIDGAQICPTADRWLAGRQDKTCNIDPISSLPAALNVKLRATSQTSGYAVPNPSTLGINGVPATLEALRERARDELNYAELSLCMARQLREKLDTAEVAFSSPENVVALQTVVYERSLTAVYKYSIISKLLASSVAPPTTINDTSFYPAVIVALGRSSSTAVAWRGIGNDFANAIQLLIESTGDLIQLQLNSSAAQQSFGIQAPDSDLSYAPPYNASDLTGPRVEMLNLLYGKGPLQWFDPPATPPFNNLSALRQTRPQAVLTDLSAPQIGQFLGLARRANALHLALSQIGSPPIPELILTTSLSTMWRMVENMLRADDCARGIPNTCHQYGQSEGVPTTTSILTTRYGITQDHALALVKALAEAAFGPPTSSTRTRSDYWNFSSSQVTTYLNAKASPAYASPIEQRPFHLLGAHSYVSTNGAMAPTPPITYADWFVGDTIIDPNFSVRPLTAVDRQSIRPAVRLPQRDMTPLADGDSQFGTFAQDFLPPPVGPTKYARPIGAVTALALARESLIQLGAANISVQYGKNLYLNATNSGGALTALEKSIGTRQVLVRQSMGTLSFPSSCTGCFVWVGSPDPIGVTEPINVNVITKSTDAATSMCVSNGIPNAMTAVLSQSYVSPGGVRGSTIPTIPCVTLTNTSFGSDVFRTGNANFSLQTPALGASVFLRSGTSTFTYEHAYTGVVGDQTMGQPTHAGVWGAVVSYGGSLNQIVEQTWAFNHSIWSQPTYDAFGLPRNWAPSADASLAGDSTSVTTQQHFIERAADAAQQASQALQEAEDQLQQQATDDLLLDSADQKAAQLTSLELQSVCGPQTPCAASPVRRSFNVATCVGTGTPKTYCDTVRNNILKLIGSNGSGPTIEAAVNTELTNLTTAPTFGAYQGGTLQGILLSQWTAWKAVESAIATAIGSVNAAEAAMLSAGTEDTAARADIDTAKAEINADLAALIAQQAGITLQRDQFNAQVASYTTQIDAAAVVEDAVCNNFAMDNARDGGWSYPGNNQNDTDSASWSPGSLNGQMNSCAAAGATKIGAQLQARGAADTSVQILADLDAQFGAIGMEGEFVKGRMASAYARLDVADQRWVQSLIDREAAETTAYQSVQAAFGQLMATIPAVAQAFASADEANARQAIDTIQTSYDVRTRFGLRKRYRSYDLWRARALNDNARRLAVAARRSIESRYVVDLSQLKAAEPFVDAPAVWADDVYSTDLRPSSIGLTRAPEDTGGVYANKLVDYVQNLRLFLDGYGVARPTAVVQSDTDIMQFGGPAHEVDTSRNGTNISYVDDASIGWAFYCPTTATWVTNPAATALSTSGITSAIPTLCDTNNNGAGDAPPSRARLTFTLDPWGRLSGSTGSPPPTARYNVRLGALAINLVGTGIHDCTLATDPSACYAEPFVNYDLRQIGPIWVSGYDQSWHSLDVPPAFAENGKGLTVEEWLDPVSNGFSRSDVTAVARSEFVDRPIGGSYELYLDLTPDIRVERIERIQLLYQTQYWVRQQ